MLAAAHRFLAFSLGLILLSLVQASYRQEPVTSPAPPEAENLLEAMHNYAFQYVSAIPDFVCQQITEQFQAGKKGDHWKQLDSLTSKLVFADHHEHRTLELVNGHRPGGFHFSRRPLVSEGEFAILLSNIFGERSNATFEWQGWQDVKGRHCAVFKYRINREHSTMKLSRSDLASATVAYGGLVFGDSTNGAVRRITSEADDIPADLETRSIATTIDYSPVIVGGSSYLLPSDASVEIATPSGRTRNELHFRNYQKFEARSTITFDPDSTPPSRTSPPPLP